MSQHYNRKNINSDKDDNRIKFVLQHSGCLPIFIFMIFCMLIIESASQSSDILQDSTLGTPDIIKKYGYPCEVHHVVTDDGYILEMHRIPKKGAMPVLLVHGLLDSSATFVIMGPNKGLAYFLAGAGYDVWMTNMRGNTYSRTHTEYSVKHAKFWDFTFHEMGKYDLPASIDHVLNLTGRDKLHYIGHSQGTLTFWIMNSERPEYSRKVLLMQALAPVAFIKHSKSPIIAALSALKTPLNFFLRLIGVYEVLPRNEFRNDLSNIICVDFSITTAICPHFIFSIVGYDKAQLNETMLPVILGHFPAGASRKQLQHYGQLKDSGHFRQFKYGYFQNLLHYGAFSPPKYNLQSVSNKVALHYAENDFVAAPEDVEHLYQELPNVIGKYLVNFPDFNHMDFVWGIDVREMLYSRVLDLMHSVEDEDAKKYLS